MTSIILDYTCGRLNVSALKVKGPLVRACLNCTGSDCDRFGQWRGCRSYWCSGRVSRWKTKPKKLRPCAGSGRKEGMKEPEVKVRETGEVRETDEVGETREVRKTGEVEETREVRETGEVGETGEV